MGLEDLVRARALASGAVPADPTMAPELAALLASIRPPQAPTTPLDPRGQLDPLAGMLRPYGNSSSFGSIGALPGAGPLGGMGLPPGAPGGLQGDFSGGSATGGSFTAQPPGQDFQGYDLTPKLVNYQGVETTPAYARLIRAAEQALGMPEISEHAGSDYRSHAEQAELYRQHLAGLHPAPVAPPGQSYHEQGEAIDWETAWLAQHPEVRDFFTSHGVVFDVPGEPWHGHLAEAPHVGSILNPGSSRRRGTSTAPPSTSTRRRRRGGTTSYTGSRQQR